MKSVTIFSQSFDDRFALQLTGQPESMNLAMSAGDTVWRRGLLVKGYGLCHGAAGNGYVFLNLYRITNETRWLHRAIKVRSPVRRDVMFAVHSMF